MAAKGGTEKRVTRIDKDVMTTMKQSKILSILYDFMWSYRHFPYVALAMLLGEAIIGHLIIQYVPYTEIDWKAYMQQVEMFKAGERDYAAIRGDTGPLVYPAGFLYVFSILHSVTNNGQDIQTAQYIFLGFYIVTIGTIFAICYRARVVPPWATIFLCTSKRLHSIYVLRLFNDGVAMMLAYIAIYLFTRQRWRWGCAVFSFAVSIKMNVLLFAPALFFLLLQSGGILRTAWYLLICAGIQIGLAYPFLRHNWVNYLSKAFELDRVFMYKWTVNWKFVPEEIFVSKWMAWGLLACHVFFLLLFLEKHFRIRGTFIAVMQKPWAIYEPFPIRSEVIVTSLFSANFVGIVFSRTMHYQFYCWYYPTLPYLLWKTNMPLLFKAKVLIISEYAFNAYPASTASSLALQISNLFFLIMLLATDDALTRYIPYLDAESRQNLITFVNEESFDGSRMLARYYGSITEDLSHGARAVSIDENELVLHLPELKLTLAVGFASSGPITTEGYGRQVLQGMITEAEEGVADGETMGTRVAKQWEADEKKEKKDKKALRKRNVA